MPEPLDRYEKRILALLQEDASLSTAAIAEEVGLSSSPCWRRIDRLEREGFIKRKVALVDRKKIGLNAQIFAQIKLNAHGDACTLHGRRRLGRVYRRLAWTGRIRNRAATARCEGSQRQHKERRNSEAKFVAHGWKFAGGGARRARCA